MPTVLLVDDDPLMRSTLRRIVQQEKVNVVCAEDGIQAMQLLHANLKPSLILLDIEMPRMNGWQVLEQLRRDPELSPIPVAVVSGSPPTSGHEIVAFLPKPFRVSDLIALIREHCYAGRAPRERR